MSKKTEVTAVLGGKIKEVCEKMDEKTFLSLQEIRIRQGRPLCLKKDGQTYFVTKSGVLKEVKTNVFIPDRRDILSTGEVLAGYSRFAFQEEMRRGYFTIAGGHREGLCGHALVQDGAVVELRQITGLNIRCAKEVKGCAEVIFPYVVEKGRVQNTLILSPPGCGKTTLLRDLVRLVSNAGFCVGLVDERSEIAACFGGETGNDCGENTDVLDGCPKTEGILMLLRSMAPEVIAVDELGGENDLAAVFEASLCGVSVIATCHGACYADLERRKGWKEVLDKRVFDRLIFLEKDAVGKLRTVTDGTGKGVKKKEALVH